MSRWLVAVVAVLSCRGGAPPPRDAVSTSEVSPSLFLPSADFELYVEPPALAHDGHALPLSASQVERASLGLGTILAASERIWVRTHRTADGQIDVGMSISGTPASMGPEDVVDQRGERRLVPCGGELRTPCFRDAALSSQGAPARRLYVLEPREWFIAAGPRAIARAESVLSHGRGSNVLPVADRVIWKATYLGSSLRHTVPKLRAGPLAALADGLVRVEMTKERKKDVMEVMALYETPSASEDAEPLASRVLAAWSRTRDDPQGRLVSLIREGNSLRVLLRGEVSALPE